MMNKNYSVHITVDSHNSYQVHLSKDFELESIMSFMSDQYCNGDGFMISSDNEKEAMSELVGCIAGIIAGQRSLVGETLLRSHYYSPDIIQKVVLPTGLEYYPTYIYNEAYDEAAVFIPAGLKNAKEHNTFTVDISELITDDEKLTEFVRYLLEATGILPASFINPDHAFLKVVAGGSNVFELRDCYDDIIDMIELPNGTTKEVKEANLLRAINNISFHLEIKTLCFVGFRPSKKIAKILCIACPICNVLYADDVQTFREDATELDIHHLS